jgi:hypothetical protein
MMMGQLLGWFKAVLSSKGLSLGWILVEAEVPKSSQNGDNFAKSGPKITIFVGNSSSCKA